MSGQERDALEAVARVRRVREQDSRIGLIQAEQEADAALTVLESLRAQLVQSAPVAPESLAGFVFRRTALVAAERAGLEAESAADSARMIADSARAHWQVDRTRLEAIEVLAERRAEERRTELRRAEAARLDEVATQLWSRTRGGMAS